MTALELALSSHQPTVIAYQAQSFACLASLGRHVECLSLVNKGLELNNANPDLYIMRARLHQLANRITECYYDVRLEEGGERREGRFIGRDEKAHTDRCTHAESRQKAHKKREYERDNHLAGKRWSWTPITARR